MNGVAGELHKKKFDLPAGLSIIPVDLATGDLLANGAAAAGEKISREIFLGDNIPEEVRWLKKKRLDTLAAKFLSSLVPEQLSLTA